MREPPYVVTHVTRLLSSYLQLTGRPLLESTPGETDADAARRLYGAPFVVLAHDDQADPCFSYANLAAQRLFERTWDEFVGLPSRLSAEAPARDERERLLARVTRHGFIDDYTGVRISKSGRRFRILGATVWNVSDASGRRIGQAASFSAWEPCAPAEDRLTIVSGGQTGIDRGALDAALDSRHPCGGWCPDGRQAEDGRIPDRYPVRELAGDGYPERTRKNVEDSDGTLILHRGPLSGGTHFTLDCCRELQKPVLLIDAATTSVAQGAQDARAFIEQHAIRRLNVAGPRASVWPEARDFAHAVITALLALTDSRTADLRGARA
jgi:hypothetical protein